MITNNYLNIKGTLLNQDQLNKYFKEAASDHVLSKNSSLKTYPIKRLNENYLVIKSVYKLLNEHIKLSIPIHPAGEWVLDNFYIIEETVKNISKNLNKEKYKSFPGITNDEYNGFARIYLLAAEMVAYTDGKIDDENLEQMIRSYQTKKNLSMEEVWNVGLFIQISLIENIRQICEKIYWTQIQKYKVESIIERTIDKKDSNNQIFKQKFIKNELIKANHVKNSFVEYMSYRLKKYGKKAYAYNKVLEEELEKSGTNITEVIKKEHFDIALKKVLIGNFIKTLKNINMIDFAGVFEKNNEVEEILKKDPAKQYEKMDNETKNFYRAKICEIAKKEKCSEIYIAKKCLKSALNGEGRKSHIGYYLLNYHNKNENNFLRTFKYVATIWFFVLLFSGLTALNFYNKLKLVNNNIFFNVLLSFVLGLILIIPIENIVTKIIQYFLSRIIKPKLIPKLDFEGGIPKEYSTMVVIPCILKSSNQVKELFEKLEVFYLANKSDNIYFTLLGDCSQSQNEIESFDDEVIAEGIKCSENLSNKYKNQYDNQEQNELNQFNKFNFIYRKRIWNDKEESYLGWERKRGLLNQFNSYILEKTTNPFRVNTIESIKENLPKIKYIITLDSDTELTLNTGFKLIGAMAHILNRPILNDKKDLVVFGHGIIAPRVGINLENINKSEFTSIFGGQAGTDSYTNAISDLYQDVFDEGIFAGKGIYDLEVFDTVLENEIKENTVLSHDLLEGCYLRSAYASDIIVMDGCPSNYLSYKKRLYRWIRGDWQITLWLKNYIENKKKDKKKNPLTFLSKYKIISNILREKLDEKILELIIFSLLFSIIFKTSFFYLIVIAIISSAIPSIIDLINCILFKSKKMIKTKTFNNNISGIKVSIYRTILEVLTIPEKAYYQVKAEIVTLYRMYSSKKYLLEWETAEEAEKSSKQDLISYYKNMLPNVIFGIILFALSICFIGNLMPTNISFIKIKFLFLIVLSLSWCLDPFVMYLLGKNIEKEKQKENLSLNDKELLNDVAYRTWKFFKDNLTKQNNYLPPDNYQEDRKPKYINRTSSTNIGLALLSIISSYDLKFEDLESTIELLNNILNTVFNMQKWNGHLYNWYNIETLEPLVPRYISSVDSGNFVGYLYVVIQFLFEAKEKIEKYIKDKSKNENQEEKFDRNILKEDNLGTLKTLEQIDSMIKMVKDIIQNTNFKMLYNEKIRLFSVGFDVEENRLTNSYYDLLASEARQASLVAIAKKDVSSKHWNNLSRTLTMLNNYKGLISWSGTSFEYLMPTINIPSYKGSILDESVKFLIMSQKLYAKKLGVPWGFSEAAFNLKDLYGNYQYKAFGIPWLGLKRGLADEIVVSSYGSILAITEDTKCVIDNLKRLKEIGMYDKYGFYESVDFTPSRVNNEYEIVKTYMAHHQGLILLSINNLFNNEIIKNRFIKNPEIKAIKILLEERMPDNIILTKEEKENPKRIKYVDYENYSQRVYNKIHENLNISNVISNDNYKIVMDENGNGYSEYKDIRINRFKETDDEEQGIKFYIKNVLNSRIWTNNYSKYLSSPDKYSISFAPNVNIISRIDGNIKTETKIFIDNDDPVEIRRLSLENMGTNEQTLEIISYLEPILSKKFQDFNHKAFNNLFITYEYINTINTIIIKRKARSKDEKEVYLAIKMNLENDINSDMDFEIDKEKFFGRDNINLPKQVEFSNPFSKKIEQVTDPIIAFKKIINIKPNEKKNIDLFISISEEKEKAIENISKFIKGKNVIRSLELSKARVEAETRYLGLKGKDIEKYQKILSYLLFPHKYNFEKNSLNIINNIYLNNNKSLQIESLWKFGISGDLPILLLKINSINDIDILKEVIDAFDYFKSIKVDIDLVILNEEKEGYESYVKDAIEAVLFNKSLKYLINVKGGIFLLNNINSNEDKFLIEAKSNLVIDASKGYVEEQIKDLENDIKENSKQVSYDVINNNNIIIDSEKDLNKENETFGENLKYYNEYGGFSNDGKEYLIKVNKNNKLPTVWSHILANENFGTLVTESLGGYTWSNNSRLNRLTAWSNNQVSDVPSEIIYLKDMDTGKKWSMGLNPMPDNNDYFIKYGFGYASFKHCSNGINQILDLHVPVTDDVKINFLRLENNNSKLKRIKLIYYLKPVLGEDEIKTNGKIYLNYNKNLNMISLRNTEDKDINKSMFLASSEKIRSYTGSKLSFLGNKNISNPEGLDQIELDRQNTYGIDGILAVQLDIFIEAFSTKEIAIVIGQSINNLKNEDLAYKYSNINNCKESLTKTKKYWSDLVNTIQIKTPMESMNILANGWLIYQTIVSRLYARTGFYQSGGAFGFRDQLQDCLAIKYFDQERVKKQIIEHAKHEFIEGDVEHWWHNENQMGIRTRFSDDLLWLVYVVLNYISFTNDYTILEEEANYLEGKDLEVSENEKYDKYKESKLKGSIYEHCVKAIEKSLKFGKNGLPLIGSGDWNDGFSNVGVKNVGESVWLGFFMYDILTRFSKICEYKKDDELKKKYLNLSKYLKKNLNNNAWDGRWYKRAFTDDGDTLGTIQNEECRIDSIAQSWATISNAGDNDKKYISMDSLDNHLVDRENEIIKLLDPPFEKSKLEPGYIKSYIPGTRENGGQYTHAAIWAIIANAMLNLNERVYEYFKIINPIEHSKTKEIANKYRVEPYVVAADVYGTSNLAGRGGWTWYTGSSSWMYVLIIEYILGIKIRDNFLTIDPHIPEAWNEFEVKISFKSSIFNVKVRRKNGIRKIFLNNCFIEENKINITDDEKIYNILVEI